MGAGFGPQQLGAIIKGGSSLVSGGLNIAGGNMTASALKSANRAARKDINAGYDTAEGYQQPIYDKALGAYTDLNDKYKAGAFSNPQMSPFKWDSSQVFEGPEYQAQMRAGTQALDSSAQSKGMLFSGPQQRDLEKYGQDVFAGRSDALYKRAKDASDTAFDQNALSNRQNFLMGESLMSPLSGAASNLSSLGIGRGSDLASLDQERGLIRAGNISGTFGNLVNMNNQQADAAISGIPDFGSGFGGGGGMMGGLGKMSSLTGSMYTPRSGMA
jgi:hypothetical protein